jgi:predicted aconitase
MKITLNELRQVIRQVIKESTLPVDADQEVLDNPEASLDEILAIVKEYTNARSPEWAALFLFKAAKEGKLTPKAFIEFLKSLPEGDARVLTDGCMNVLDEAPVEFDPFITICDDPKWRRMSPGLATRSAQVANRFRR